MSGRPPHPLFGGGGMKNELAMAAKSMNARHGGIQETVAQGSGASAPAAATPKTPSRAPPTLAPAAAPVARPPHPLFGGGGGLSELKSAAKSMNARHGGIQETKAQTGKASPSASAPSRPKDPPASSARPPHPMAGGMMSLQDQIKAKAAKRNARVQAGETVPASAPPPSKPAARPLAPAPRATPKVVPPPQAPPMAMAPSLADQIAAKAAQRKDRLGYQDPVAAKPQREGPRPVPAADSWMAPAEKWVSAPPVDLTPPVQEPPSDKGPIKTVTKTEKHTKPTVSKRIIRRKIIKKADGTQETITTIIDAATGQEINQDGTPIKPLAESTDYETTKTVTKTSTPLNGDEEDKKVTTDTSTYISSERPSYMPDPIVTVRRIEPSSDYEDVPDEPSAEQPSEPVESTPLEPQGEETPLPDQAASWMAPAEKWTRNAPVEPSPPSAEEAEPEPEPEPVPAPMPAVMVASKPEPVAPKPVQQQTGTRGPAKVLNKAKPAPAAPESSASRTVEGTVVTTTRTVTTTKTFIPAKKKKSSLFSAPAMKHGTSKVTVTTTKSEAGSREEPVGPPATAPKAKRGWFGRKKG